MIKRYFPPVRETMLVVVITVVFLLLTATCIGLRPEHFLMAGLFFVLFFAGKTTRKLAVALLPFIIFGVSYDWMRVYPNYQVNPIDVQGLYEAEKSLSLLGACAYCFRFVALSEGRPPDVSALCNGLFACESDWFCGILHSSCGTTLVCHELWF